MKRHVRIHEDKDQICALCPGKKFNAAGLKIRIRDNHRDGNFPCKSCDFLATSSLRLKNHVDRIHKVHNCNECGHVSATSGNLAIHKKNKHEGLRFKCPECDYQATQKGNMAIHKEAVQCMMV